RTIENYMFLPNQPPLYMLNDPKKEHGLDTAAAYTKKQLMLVNPNEQPPPVSVIRGKPALYKAEKLIKKKKSGNKIMYLVKWYGYPESESTWEPRTTLIQDIPKLVADYERLHKK
ncbi:MAG TPA: chromo domain-containing protein, partial [Candidatus Dojkabacteria bacterium]|nr:chromo domain-containing protein [Candidatus Dojkabacteria bacterium]